MRGTWHLPKSDTSGPEGRRWRGWWGQLVFLSLDRYQLLLGRPGSRTTSLISVVYLDSFHLSVLERNWVEAQMPMQSPLAHFVRPVPPFWVSLPAPPPSQSPGPGVRKLWFKRPPLQCPMAPGPSAL